MNDQAFLEAKIAGLESEVRQLKETLRDRFAAHALAGDFANPECGVCPTQARSDRLLASAGLYFRMADAMLEARKS